MVAAAASACAATVAAHAATEAAYAEGAEKCTCNRPVAEVCCCFEHVAPQWQRSD
ncbi:hypothetical protein [Streptodolium elevatio]|uniref:Uncharacterized protein n=1 Tax=Streptodolium elevatio TaxID=3157996 RepID=A0ABV3DSS8_9ACTN